MNPLIKQFKEKMLKGESVLGLFMKTSDPAFVEAAGFSGMDFVILDIEHGPNNEYILQNLIRGAQCGNILPIVRVSGSEESGISKVLDIGAMGVQIPQVTNAEEVKKVIRAARFSPDGERGVCRFVRAAKYSSMDRYEYFKESGNNLIIIQLEGTEAIDNIDEIMSVDGVDIIFVGPYDLSQSLGIPGQIDHPKVEEKMQQIVDKARSINKSVGTFVDTIENALKWKARGVQYLAFSVDVGIFTECCADLVKTVLK